MLINLQLKSSKDLLGKGNISKAVNLIRLSISEIQESILNAETNDKASLKTLCQLLGKAYKYLARTLSQSNRINESLVYYKKSYSTILKNFGECANLEKVKKELLTASNSLSCKQTKQNLVNLGTISTDKFKKLHSIQKLSSVTRKSSTPYSKPSRVPISPLKGAHHTKNSLGVKKVSIDESCEDVRVTGIIKRIKENELSNIMIARNRRFESKNSSVIAKNYKNSKLEVKTLDRIHKVKQPEADLLDKTEKETYSSRIEKQDMSYEIYPTRISYSSKGEQSETKSALRQGEDLKTRNPVLTMERMSYSPVLNRMQIDSLSKKGKEDRFAVVKTSNLRFGDSFAQISYCLTASDEHLNIIYTRNSEKHEKLIKIQSNATSVIDYINDHIEPYLDLKDNVLQILEITKQSLCRGYIFEKSSVNYISIMSLNPRKSLELTVISASGDQRVHCSNYFCLQSKPYVPASIFFVGDSLELLACAPNSTQKLYKNYCFSLDHSQVRVEMYLSTYLKTKFLIILVKDSEFVKISIDVLPTSMYSADSCEFNFNQILSALSFKDSKLSISLDASSELKIPSEDNQQAIDAHRFTLSVQRIQKYFRAYLLSDKQRLLNPNNQIIDKLSITLNSTQLLLTLKSHQKSYSFEANLNKKTFLVHIPHKDLPSQRYFYVKLLISSLKLNGSTLQMNLYKTSYTFNDVTEETLEDSRIIYRHCKFVNHVMYTIFVNIINNELLEFTVISGPYDERRLRIDIEALSGYVGIEKKYLSDIVNFTVKSMLIIKEEGVFFLDVSKKFSIEKDVVTIQAFLRGQLVRKALRYEYMKMIYKNTFTLYSVKYVVIIFQRRDVILLRYVRGYDVFGENYSQRALEKAGLLTDLDNFYTCYIKSSVKFTKDKKIIIPSLDKYKS